MFNRTTVYQIRRCYTAVVLAGMLTGVGAAEAAVQQIYTDKTGFLSAISGVTNLQESFDTATVGQVPDVGLPLLHFDLVPLNTNVNYLRIDPGNGPLQVDGTRYAWADVRATGAPTFAFELNFSQPIHAFGADWKNARSGTSVALQDQNNILLTDMYSDWPATVGNGFFGFTLTQPITKLRFRTGGGPGHSVENFGMDNVVLALPEPASLLSLAGGAIIAASRRRRR